MIQSCPTKCDFTGVFDKVTDGGGLYINVLAFHYEIAGVHGYYAGITHQILTDNSTNYLYLNNAGILIINTTGFPTSGAHIRLASVVTLAGDVQLPIINHTELLITSDEEILRSYTGASVGVSNPVLTNTDNYYTHANLPNPVASNLIEIINNLNEQIGNRDYTGAFLTSGQTDTASHQALSAAISAIVTTADSQYWIKGLTGDDSKSGLTVGNARKTIPNGVIDIPGICKHNVAINLREVFREIGTVYIGDKTTYNGKQIIIDGGEDRVDVGGIAYISAVSSINTLQVSPSPGWTVDALIGRDVSITSGPADGESQVVLSNTTDTITVVSPFSISPGALAGFVVGAGELTTTGASTAYVDVAGASWTTNQFEGWFLTITSGPAIGCEGMIYSNTTTRINVGYNLTINPGVGAKFKITRPKTTIVSNDTYSYLYIKGMLGGGQVRLQNIHFTGSKMYRLFYNNQATVNFCRCTINDTMSTIGGTLVYYNSYLIFHYLFVDPVTFSAVSAKRCGVGIRGTITFSVLAQACNYLQFYASVIKGISIGGCGIYDFRYSAITEKMFLHNVWSVAAYTTSLPKLFYAGGSNGRNVVVRGSSGNGVEVVDCPGLADEGATIENCLGYGLLLRNSSWKSYAALAGTGNSYFGVYCMKGGKYEFNYGNKSTITGAYGDFGMSSPTVKEGNWTDFTAVGDTITSLNEQSQIKAVTYSV